MVFFASEHVTYISLLLVYVMLVYLFSLSCLMVVVIVHETYTKDRVVVRLTGIMDDREHDGCELRVLVSNEKSRELKVGMHL